MLTQADHDIYNDLQFLVNSLPTSAWVALFSSVSLYRIHSLIFEHSNIYFNLSISVLSIWLWVVVLVSSTILTPPDSLDLILIIPVIIETWILARDIGDRKNAR
jgi:hypothetical protein